MSTAVNKRGTAKVYLCTAFLIKQQKRKISFQAPSMNDVINEALKVIIQLPRKASSNLPVSHKLTLAPLSMHKHFPLLH